MNTLFSVIYGQCFLFCVFCCLIAFRAVHACGQAFVTSYITLPHALYATSASMNNVFLINTNYNIKLSVPIVMF